MPDIQTEAQRCARQPMSTEQRAKLAIAQRAYVANDPRWLEHRRKLAAAQEARRMTLFENEVTTIVAMRKKGPHVFVYRGGDRHRPRRDPPRVASARHLDRAGQSRPAGAPGAGLLALLRLTG
jgi:hypothetical protein